MNSDDQDPPNGGFNFDELDSILRDTDFDDNELDYQHESYIERFRRLNPSWTEEEIANYFAERVPKVDPNSPVDTEDLEDSDEPF